MPRCRGARLQYHQKVNKKMRLYPVGDGISKRKKLYWRILCLMSFATRHTGHVASLLRRRATESYPAGWALRTLIQCGVACPEIWDTLVPAGWAPRVLILLETHDQRFRPNFIRGQTFQEDSRYISVAVPNERHWQVVESPMLRNHTVVIGYQVFHDFFDSLVVSACSVRVYIRGQISGFLIVLHPPLDPTYANSTNFVPTRQRFSQ